MGNQRQLNSYKYLSFSNFKSLTFWDYYTLSKKSQILSDYELTPLSKVIKQRKYFIKIDDKKEYMRCRVKLHGKGILLRDKIFGSEIKTKKQQLCKENDFLIAEIDAKFGGYGIVPKELEEAIVSGHYFLFEIDKKCLIPGFLSILVKCDGFSKQVKATGSTNYAAIRPYHVLDYIIPLPPPKEQNRIVQAYNKRIQFAEQQEQEAKQIEQDIESYLFDVLGIKNIEEKKSKKGLQFVKFKNVERWAVDFLRKVATISKILKGKYEFVKLKELIISYQYGLSEKASKEKIGIPMLRMNNIFNSETVFDNLKYIDIDEPTKNKYRLNRGDLLFNRTNSKELVGKTAIFNEDGEYTFASYLIRAVINSKKSNPNYINYLFNSSLLKYQKDMTSRQITGQANINAQEMQDFLFPLPPLKIQTEIADNIGKMKLKIKTLQLQAKENRKLAIEEFEKEIFQ